ncbi:MULTISPECIES: DUF1203 domain-containing protein [Inquilinus]|uniref:DUF1203 domain-containing protein n=1 Tax=Inquilinus ginsengisoli TaxID=363840 RepID=A0ABU1K458_9PROT|nr:DUF1203 domain-containing protein [Inquilinus ginsengisoli]MDR6294544.1 hypothetical protein [Inquilinus ginsengisoli]
MSDFRCVPIPAEVGGRWSRTGVDDNGNQLRRLTVDGAPCRHCLRDAAAGEESLLGSYRLPRPQGIYWTPSPIFVHAEPCRPFEAINEVAPIVRNRLVSVRAYDRDDQCIYDLGHVADGNEIDEALLRALDDARTAFVNIHTAKPGCMLCRVERA